MNANSMGGLYCLKSYELELSDGSGILVMFLSLNKSAKWVRLPAMGGSIIDRCCHILRQFRHLVIQIHAANHTVTVNFRDE